MLLNLNATVTVAHSKTRNLKEICKEAEILIIAVGKPNFIDSSYVKRGSVVIDVGIHRLKSSDKNKTCKKIAVAIMNCIKIQKY